MNSTLTPLGKIKPNPSNPRTIKDAKFKRLVESIRSFPKMLELRPIVVNDDMIVLGGNMRLKACKEAGITEVPVIKASDLTPEEQRQFIIKDNVGFGDWDWEMLANEWDVAELDEWGMDLPKDMFKIEKQDIEDIEAEAPETLQTNIKLGDIFEIGPHRLMCGDSTDPEQFSRLMNSQKADMVFTDPPYGVNIEGSGQNRTIAGDITQTAIPFAFENCINETKDAARFYFCGASGNISLYIKLFERYLRMIPRFLIWVKNGFVMKPNGYHAQYEIIFHGYKSGGGDLKMWHAGRTEAEASDVWQVKRDSGSTYEHPTQKPIELPARAIRNHSTKGMLVLEPFGGSGSTMVAAHQLDRVCYAMELDPVFCQVIVNRMLRTDPDLVIKCNGQVWNPEPEQHG